MKQISTHPSGLRVITYEMPHMNSVSIGIWIGAGGRCETDDNNGISHFIEHLVFKGTPKRTGKEISQAIEGLGGVLNAFTGEEYTCYFAKVLSEYFDTTFDVLWDMVDNDQFLIENIQKEKSVVKEEINMYLDLPDHYVHDLLNQVLWPQQPLGRILIGSVATVDALSTTKIDGYKKEFYKLNNIVVSAAGNVNHKKVYDTVCSYITRTQSGPAIPEMSHVIENQDKPAFHTMKKDTEQTHIALGIRAFHREHQDRFILKILNTVLGENMSSRLFQTVREDHGLAYSIHSSIDKFKDTGALVVSAGVEEDNLYKTIELVLREMDSIRKNGISLDELDRAKTYSLGQLSLGLEKTMNIMMWMGENLLCSNKVMEIDEILQHIKEVSLDDIVRVSETLFRNDRLNIAVIGPLKNSAEIQNILQFN